MIDKVGCSMRLAREWIRCGRKECKKCAAGGKGHGPYFYLYGRRNGKRTKVYLGSKLRWPFDRFDAPAGLDVNPDE